MPDPFKFELVSPERLLVSGNVEQVIVPGSEGEMTVLAHHAPLLTTLRPGLLDIGFPGGGEHQRYFVRGGFAEVSPAGLTVLAETAIDLVELDAAQPCASRQGRRGGRGRRNRRRRCATVPRPSSTSFVRFRPPSISSPIFAGFAPRPYRVRASARVAV